MALGSIFHQFRLSRISCRRARRSTTAPRRVTSSSGSFLGREGRRPNRPTAPAFRDPRSFVHLQIGQLLHQFDRELLRFPREAVPLPMAMRIRHTMRDRQFARGWRAPRPSRRLRPRGGKDRGRGQAPCRWHRTTADLDGPERKPGSRPMVTRAPARRRQQTGHARSRQRTRTASVFRRRPQPQPQIDIEIAPGFGYRHAQRTVSVSQRSPGPALLGKSRSAAMIFQFVGPGHARAAAAAPPARSAGRGFPPSPPREQRQDGDATGNVFRRLR